MLDFEERGPTSHLWSALAFAMGSKRNEYPEAMANRKKYMLEFAHSH